jgi:hypothetical protein
MKTTERENKSLKEIDALNIKLAWDAEMITREEDAPIYSFWPAEPLDSLIAARAGAAVRTTLKKPVIIWRNGGEEN